MRFPARTFPAPASNTAADHIEGTRLALAQLPRHLRRRVLIRADSGGGTHEFLAWLPAKSRRLRYSVGMTVTEDIQAAVGKVPAAAWTPAYDPNGQVREGAWVADITDLLELGSWPAGMRVIVRKERPHPGAQLRFTDTAGHRFTAFATSTKRGQLADLELRHRRRARCEDRVRCAKDTGLRNLPLKGFAQNQLWCEIVALACELIAWTQLFAQAGAARRWEPNSCGCASSPPPPPAGPPVRLTSPSSPITQKGNHQGPWNPAHPARQPGSQARPHTDIQTQPSISGHHNEGTKDRGLRLPVLSSAAKVCRLDCRLDCRSVFLFMIGVRTEDKPQHAVPGSRKHMAGGEGTSMKSFRLPFSRPVRRGRWLAALAGGTALATAAVLIGAVTPALAGPVGQIYLASATEYVLYVPGTVKQGAKMEIGLGNNGNQQWSSTDQGAFDSNGVKGEGEEFASYGTKLCIADTVNPGGGNGIPTLQPCGANGTVWVACVTGDGYYLYNRFFLGKGGGSKNTFQLGINLDQGNNLIMINEDYATSPNWYLRWKFPIPAGDPPACI